MEINSSVQMPLPATVIPVVPEPMDKSILNEPAVKSLFLVIYILVFLSCVFGNSLILVIIISNRNMRTVTNFFLANLAIADLLVGIFCVFQNAVHFVFFEHGIWPFGRIMCHSYSKLSFQLIGLLIIDCLQYICSI